MDTNKNLVIEALKRSGWVIAEDGKSVYHVSTAEGKKIAESNK